MSDDFVPADGAPSQRLLDQHDLVIDALGGSLLLFPFDLSRGGLQILESGCADGHWLQQLSRMSPNSSTNRYVGTDINPSLFPTSHPAYFQFYKHNIADPWPEMEHNRYDLVHQRLTLLGAGSCVRQAVKNVFALVKPGGWMQLVEAEQVGPDSGPIFTHEFMELIYQVAGASGAGTEYAGKMREWVEEEGAVEVHEIRVDMAFGAAHKDAVLAEKGATCTAGAVAGLVTHAKMMELNIKFTDEEMATMAERLLSELRTTGAHYPLRAIWARKKLESDIV